MNGVVTYPERKKLQPHKAAKTWVLVADSHTARFYEYKSNGRPHLTSAGGKLSAEEFEPQRGRSRAMAGAGHHAFEPSTDPKEDLLIHFIQYEVAKRLEEAHAARSFDQLVVLAPPKALGLLRSSLSQAVKDTIIAEAAKELTNISETELGNYLKDNNMV